MHWLNSYFHRVVALTHPVHIERIENIRFLHPVREAAHAQASRQRGQREPPVRRAVVAAPFLPRDEVLRTADDAAPLQAHIVRTDAQNRRDNRALNQLCIVIAHIAALSTQKTPSYHGQRNAALLARSIHLSSLEKDTHLLRTLHRNLLR